MRARVLCARDCVYRSTQIRLHGSVSLCITLLADICFVNKTTSAGYTLTATYILPPSAGTHHFVRFSVSGPILRVQVDYTVHQVSGKFFIRRCVGRIGGGGVVTADCGVERAGGGGWGVLEVGHQTGASAGDMPRSARAAASYTRTTRKKGKERNQC